MNFHIITLFPDLVRSYLSESILARAVKNKKIKVDFYNPREYVKATGAQKKNIKPYLRVDDKPYGGGAGMVLQAEPVLKAVDDALRKIEKKTLQLHLGRKLKIETKKTRSKIIIFSAKLF